MRIAVSIDQAFPIDGRFVLADPPPGLSLLESTSGRFLMTLTIAASEEAADQSGLAGNLIVDRLITRQFQAGGREREVEISTGLLPPIPFRIESGEE